MKQVLFLVVSTLAVALGWDPGFRVRFGLTGIGKDNYIDMPKTISEAQDKSWTKEKRADKHLPSLTMYCDPSFILCVFFDDTKYVAGVQVALPTDQFEDAEWDWDTQGYIKWTPSNGKSYYTKQQYFVDEEYLARNADERISNRNHKSLLSAGGSVWVSGNRGELFEIKNKPDSLLSHGFTEQGCLPGMGHHFWRLNEQTKCDSEMFPFFVLYDNNNDLVGSGMVIAGKLPELKKDWFERPPPLAVKVIVPRGPQCLYDLSHKPGFVTIHIFYVENPWLNVCLPKWPFGK